MNKQLLTITLFSMLVVSCAGAPNLNSFSSVSSTNNSTPSSSPSSFSSSSSSSSSNLITVTFDSRGGTPVNSVSLTIGSYIDSPTTTRNGYTFDGWYTSLDNGVTLDQRWNFIAFTVGRNLTLYAKWTINQYTITFNTNGGDSITSLTIDHGSTLNLPNPTRTGYTFAGWFSNTELTLQAPTTMPQQNLTLYAKWNVSLISIEISGVTDTTIPFNESFNFFTGVTATGNDGGVYTTNLTLSSTSNAVNVTTGVLDSTKIGIHTVEYRVQVGALVASKFRNVTVGQPASIGMLINPDFSLGTAGWDDPGVIFNADGSAMTLSTENGVLKAEVTAGSNPYTPRFGQMNIPFEKDVTYEVSFRAKSSAVKPINLNVGELLSAAPWFTDFKPNQPEIRTITTDWATYSIVFTHSIENTRGGILFDLGRVTGQSVNATMYFDDILIEEILSPTETVRVGMDLRYPPFETVTTDNEPEGISVDVAKAFGTFLGRPTEIVNTGFGGLIPALQSGEIDIVISSVSITDARKQVVDFTDPYFYFKIITLVNQTFATENGLDADTTTEELLALSDARFVGVVSQISSTIPTSYGKTVTEYFDLATAIEVVAAGDADILLMSASPVVNGFKANRSSTMIVWDPWVSFPIGMAVNKGNTELLASANAFIDTFNDVNGLYSQLRANWNAIILAQLERYGMDFYINEA